MQTAASGARRPSAGHLRDHADVVPNLESLNSVLIHQGLPARDRLQQLNAIAIVQVRSLVAAPA
ncbi:MAG: hypothetical protein IPM79_22515 [Polyangiaceae bacterium]|nr:hypothetical protein [Polyangiaceae bacterium]